ncbi:MAG: helix-turn-helix transcriptional regulator, partial [Gemmatimonadaceae bacterium]
LKVTLGRFLRRYRTKRGWTQTAVAGRIGSSQSRVARMEAGDSSVSLDLQVRALLALGAGLRDVAKAFASTDVVAST